MPKELKKSDSKRQKIKRDLLPRFKGRELRFSEKCIKPVKTSKSRVINVILLKNMQTLVPLSMLQSLEMVSLWIRKQINTKFNQRHFPRMQESKSSVDHFLRQFSSLKSAYKSSSLISIANSQEVKSVIKLSLRRLKQQLMFKLPKTSRSSMMFLKKTLSTKSRFVHQHHTTWVFQEMILSKTQRMTISRRGWLIRNRKTRRRLRSFCSRD